MIYMLSGRVAEVADDFCVIDVGGVGYQVYCPVSTLGKLKESEAAQLTIYTHVREDHIHLYGFLESNERALFLKLTDVSGVGAKVALALLSVMNGAQLVDAIGRGDIAAITQANGVGKKLAERLILELKSKVGSLPTSGASIGSGGGQSVPTAGVAGDVISALNNMGFKAPQTSVAVNAAIEEKGSDAAFGDIFKTALQRLKQA